MIDIAKLAAKKDEELVNLTLKDQEVFAYLIERYESKLLRYIIRISGVSWEEAEDILQEAFIKAYRNLNSFDQSLSFSSWVYRITRNQAISAYRRNKIREAGHVLNVDDSILNNIASNLDTGQAVDVAYLRQNITRVLNQLDKSRGASFKVFGRKKLPRDLRYFEKAYGDGSNVDQPGQKSVSPGNE